MNLTDVIAEIEDMDNLTDRCIAYGEVVGHLNNMKAASVYQPMDKRWKTVINKEISESTHKFIDAGIKRVYEMVELNINVNDISK